MSEQVAEYRCSRCGATFSDGKALSSHLRTHEAGQPETTRTQGESRQDLTDAYAHADREFRRARMPIFGATIAFLLVFAYAAASGAAVFAPLFVGATVVTIVSLLFLFKFLMEG